LLGDIARRNQKTKKKMENFILFEIYPASGRPSRVIGEYKTYEDACNDVVELTGGNSILAESYVVREGASVEDVTYTNEKGVWYFS